MKSFRIVALGAASSTLAMLASAPARAQVVNPPGAVVQDISGDPVANRLAEDMRTLAADPRNVPALISAGRGALAMGDANGALGFFLRAQTAAPSDGRAKAGIGSALLELERPGEALRMFQDAARLGVAETEFAADRGLAYDLVGDTARAQRDYQTALARDRDDETVRRFALSLGIVGRRDEAIAMLDPLLRKQDRGAWRARAFVLAMAGDAAGAEAIARQTLPAGMAQMLQPYFKRLGEIRSPGARAFAVHYGELGGNAALLASRAAPVPTGPAPAPVALASTAVTATSPRSTGQAAARTSRPTQLAANGTNRPESRRERRSSNRRLARNDGFPASPFAPRTRNTRQRTADTRTVADDVSGVTTTARQPVVVAAANPVRPAASPSTPSEVRTAARPSASASAQTPSRSVTPPPARTDSTTVPVGGSGAPRVYGPPATGVIAPGFASTVPGQKASVPPATSVPTASPATGIAAPVPVAPAPVITATTAPAAQPIAAIAATAGPPQAVSGLSPQDPSTLSAPSAPAAGAPSVVARSVTPVPVEAMTREQRTALLASIVGSIEVPESELASRPAVSAEEVAAAAAVRELEAQSRRRSEAAAKRRADAEAARKAEADAEAAKRKATPERHWVQIATGANPAALARDFRRMVAAKPVLKGQDGWSARFGATRRMLVGPFASESEAIAFMRKAKAAGVDGFNWTSPEGTEVEKLPGA